jgi:hypothetical protein
VTKILAEPRHPIENWQQKLAKWIAEVEEITHQARTWAEKHGWATRLDQKVITEEIIGTYEVPTLLVHTPQGRLLLQSVARYVVGADGRFDFCVMPSYDSVPLVKTDGSWGFFSTSRKDLLLPWSEEAFEKVAQELLKLQ